MKLAVLLLFLQVRPEAREASRFSSSGEFDESVDCIESWSFETQLVVGQWVILVTGQWALSRDTQCTFHYYRRIRKK